MRQRVLPSIAPFLADCLGRPREAAIAIVGYVNHKNQNVSLLALTVHEWTMNVV